MTKETIELTEELRGVRGDLRKVMGRLTWMDDQAKADRKKSKWHRLGSAAIALTVLAVIGLAVRDVQERELEEVRACERFNAGRADIRASIVESILTLGEGSTDPDRVAQMADRISERLTVTLPDRQC